MVGPMVVSMAARSVVAMVATMEDWTADKTAASWDMLSVALMAEQWVDSTVDHSVVRSVGKMESMMDVTSAMEPAGRLADRSVSSRVATMAVSTAVQTVDEMAAPLEVAMAT